MQKIAIIGGGIIGMTLANYLDHKNYAITIYDYPIGQATKASAGIISPWLSKRRNKKWYKLAREGAAFYPKLIADFHIPSTVYQQTGTLIIRPNQSLEELASLAVKRKQEAPEMGHIELFTGEQSQKKLPLLNKQSSLFISGGARLDGKQFLVHLTKIALAKNIRIKQEKATIITHNNGWKITGQSQTDCFDTIAITSGAGIPDIIKPLGYQIDTRPQKGQLLVFDTDYQSSSQWPVAMLDSESDLIPFANGKILVGATHENQAGFDLTPTKEAFQQLKEKTLPFLSKATFFDTHPVTYQIGTRAYTADFAPFFNCLPAPFSGVIASGLGSSGLTTGPYIGYLLAQYFNTGCRKNWLSYQKDLDTYLTKKQLKQ